MPAEKTWIPGESIVGVVDRVLPDKGYGFVVGPHRESYFLHHSELVDCRIEDLKSGDSLRFIPVPTAKGLRVTCAERIPGDADPRRGQRGLTADTHKSYQHDLEDED